MAKDDAKYIREAIAAEKLTRDWHEVQDEIENRKFATEATAAAAYTAKWHVTYDWAFEVLEWDGPADWFDTNPRLTRVRATIVLDAENEEEAYRKAIPVELIDEWLAAVKAPGRDDAGHRRTVIRLYTWVIDRDGEVAYDPEWLKIADDMTPLAAQKRGIRWAHSYAESLQNDTASREIRMTQIEIMFWTQGEKDHGA